MTQQEIQERNKEITSMMGFKYKNQAKYWGKYPLDNNSFLSNLGYVVMDDLKFHSDWNWLMEAVEFIEKTSAWVTIRGRLTTISLDTNVSAPTKKEAVFIAVSDFAKMYNNNKV